MPGRIWARPCQGLSDYARLLSLMGGFGLQPCRSGRRRFLGSLPTTIRQIPTEVPSKLPKKVPSELAAELAKVPPARPGAGINDSRPDLEPLTNDHVVILSPLRGVQTVDVPVGGGSIFEVRLREPGDYPLVSHAFADATKGAVGVLRALPRVAGR